MQQNIKQMAPLKALIFTCERCRNDGASVSSEDSVERAMCQTALINDTAKSSFNLAPLFWKGGPLLQP